MNSGFSSFPDGSVIESFLPISDRQLGITQPDLLGVPDGAFRLVITVRTNNTTGISIRAAALAAGWNGRSPINATVTVLAGVVVSGSASQPSAIDSGSPAIPANSVVTVINYGTLYGHGGAGGVGQHRTTGAVNQGGSPGAQGGHGVRTDCQCLIYNYGSVLPGGGGGGGGRSWWLNSSDPYSGAIYYQMRAGGGGGGRSGLNNSSGGGIPQTPSGVTNYFNGSFPVAGGGGGTINGPGGGGRGDGVNASLDSGVGATGGQWASPGGVGGGGSTNSGWSAMVAQLGGAGGFASLSTVGSTRWFGNGARLGALL